MPVPTVITDLSQTAGSNFPLGSDAPSTLDDTQRAHAAFIALLRDGKGHTNGVTLASAATTDVGGQNSLFVDVSGAVGITSFGTNYNGPRFLRFTGAPLITHSASLNIPNAANHQCVAGDILIVAPNVGATGWNVLSIHRGGVSAGAGANTDITSLASATTVTTQATTDITTKIASTAYAQAMSAKIQPITASVASNALTCTLNPTVLDFRSATLTSGTVTSRSVGSAISVVVPSTATLGTVNAVQSRLYLLAIDNAGTVELAVVNAAGGVNLDESGVISTTAIAGGSNSSTVVYSTTARTNVPYRVVGVIVSTQTTAGTWAAAPSLIQGYGGNAVGGMNSFAHGQTWQDVTGSRAFGTTYYNTTGKPIKLCVRCNNSSQSSYSQVVNGVTAQIVTHPASFGITSLSELIIPAGASYSVSSSAGTPLTPVWMELR